MIKMVVWDCDGTLINASIMIDCLFQGYHKMYPQRDKRPKEEFVKCYYYTDKETHAYLNIPDEDIHEFHALCFGINEEKMKQVKVFDHIIDVIRTLNKKGVIQGINTSRNHRTWKSAAPYLGEAVFQCFRCVVTQEEVVNPKPSPESLFYIMEKEKLNTDEILYIGDSLSDALCAKHAGVPFAYAKWGEVLPQNVPCNYVLTDPRQVLKII